MKKIPTSACLFMAPAAGSLHFVPLLRLLILAKVNFSRISLRSPNQRLPPAKAGESLVGPDARHRKKLLSKWTAAFFMAPAAGLEPAT
jgi:hypothetical protein